MEQRNDWATFDALMGVDAVDEPHAEIGALAFYGRCSTEDNQDPETSRAWQLNNATKFVQPLGGHIAAEFFDIGQSRSVPWERREAASELLRQLRDKERGWVGVVVGEGTRCWFGNQFSLTAPRFEAYGLDVWIPELGGRFDSRNASHKMLMSVLGGMSESERQHVQARVRAAMDAQVINEGRHQGGRAPYGYTVVDGGAHPNPRKAAEGYRLRLLAVDEPAAEVVRRIFSEYLDGRGDRAIAVGLNRDGVLCPSARRPEQNSHRLADGWQGSTVRSILENPRYTGYAVFGRWTKQETLLDAEDVSAGHVVRFRRARPDRIVRSRVQAHPAIVSVQDFVDVQLLRRSRGPARQTLERSRTTTPHSYALAGRVRCGYCERRMEGAARRWGTYYRCAARTLVPGSPALAGHPKTVYLPETAVVGPINRWLGELFDPDNLDRTVEALVASQGGDPGRATLEQSLKDADTRLRRFQAAIAAGVDPDAVVDAINSAQALRTAARQALESRSAPGSLTTADVRAMVGALGDIGEALNRADPAMLGSLYEALHVEAVYNAEARVVTVSIRPTHVVKACVRGGT